MCLGDYYVAAWEVGEGKFADGWIASDARYDGWINGEKNRYTIPSELKESRVSIEEDKMTITSSGAPSSLEVWLQFGAEDIGDGLEADISMCARIDLEEHDIELSEAVYAADRKVLRSFLALELTPELEGEIILTFEYCRRKDYKHYWFLDIDKIVLSEYPLEKVPEHLRDIVKEARGE